MHPYRTKTSEYLGGKDGVEMVLHILSYSDKKINGLLRGRFLHGARLYELDQTLHSAPKETAL